MESMTLRAAESVAQTIRAIGEGPNRLLIWPDVRPPGITPEIIVSAVGLEKTNCGQPDCPFHGHLNQGDEDHDGADEDPEGVDDDFNQPDDDPNGTSL